MRTCSLCLAVILAGCSSSAHVSPGFEGDGGDHAAGTGGAQAGGGGRADGGAAGKAGAPNTGGSTGAAGTGGATDVIWPSTITWIASTRDARWVTKPEPVPTVVTGAAIEVDPTMPLQSIDGWGGCFNELGWEAMKVLSSEQIDTILKSLFDAQDGCGFNISRMPIGASDYATSWYSLDETPSDYGMASFSIDRDRRELAQYIKAAMKYNPDLQVWGSAWSPPTWMKDNGAYGGGHIRQDAQTLSAYALYLSKYVQAYQAEGIHVYAVHVQNEPYSGPAYPSCQWDAASMRDFVKTYLGPRFRSDGHGAQIWLGTINNASYADVAGVVLADQQAADFITGVGYQYAGGAAVSETHDRNPDKKIMQTETACGDGSNDWGYAEYTWSFFKDYLDHFANSYMQWNMVLDETGLSTWGWKQSAMVTVDRQTKTVTYNPQYHLVRHITQYVKPGARRLTLRGSFQAALAFENPNGYRVVVLANLNDSPADVPVAVGSTAVKLSIDPHSFNTLIFPPQ